MNLFRLDRLYQISSEHTLRYYLTVSILTVLMLFFHAQAYGVLAHSTPSVAVDDVVTIDEDTSIAIEILANDGPLSDLDLNSLEIVLAPSYGAYLIQAGAMPTVLYEPYDDFWGEDLFEYQICSADGSDCSTARVSIFVEAINDPVEAVDDLAAATVGELIEIAVLTNDIDFDSDIALSTLLIVDSAQRGTAQVVEHQIHYTADQQGGVDEIRYQICETPTSTSGEETCSSATVQIVIGETEQKDEQVKLNGKLNVAPAGTDRTPSATVSIARQPNNGTAIVEADDTVAYLPVAGFAGTDEFLIELCEEANDCRTVSYSVTVGSLNVRLPVLMQ